ncbi:helix-turn-helix domain-containing protein [Crocosphaera sp. Alani8]|uniref:helix-turn-helix domain-containing protein n=1 Tax=Crocosphaera sp. Alani8 TaxID=3038952 RepID=UPI00313DF5B1
MSRKQSSINSPQQDRDLTQESYDHIPVVGEDSAWKQVWGKLILNGYQTNEEPTESSDSSKNAKKILYLKRLLQFFSKFSRGTKHHFNPKQLQKEILKEIGQKLSDERKKQGLTLELIANETHIALSLLKAIERGEIEELPEAIYTRSFIRKFADFLGLDGRSLSESFPLDNHSKSKSYSRLNFLLPVLQFRPIHLYFFYIIIVIFSVQSISNTLKRASLEGAIEQIPTPVTVSPSESQPLKKTVTIKVESKGESTLKVTADGKTIFNGTIKKETQKTWEADKNITLEASNAGVILVTFNNQNPEPLGKLGENKKITYSLTNISHE